MPNSTSMLGRYVPPGPDIADGYDRESRYITVDDGCRIAVDILHPAAGGVRLGGPRPTVLHATPYRRAWLRAENSRTAARYEQALAGIEPGQLVTQYESRPLATTLIHQGYNFVSLDLRGTGASSGASYIDSWRAGLDIAQVIDWIVDRPWATGKVGMVGISYEGMAQFFTAAFAPAGLACIVPQYPGLPQCYVDGGLAISGFARTWEALHKGISEDEPSAPVDGPDGPQLRADAEAERDPSRYDWVETFARMDPRDVTRMAAHDGILRERDRSDLGLPPVASGWIGAHDLLNAAGVPTYIVTGWWDLTFPGFLIDAFNRLTVPKKLIVGPWNHGQAGDPEALRWLDHWLKDIDNGVIDEPPVHYATSEPSGAQTWSSAPRLPLPEAQPRSLYLSAAPSATINSVHDGTLAATPTASAESVDYEVDHDVSLGLLTRHTFYTDDLYITTPDLVARGERCLTFTGAPLPDDIEIVGTPALELQLATTSDRGAIVATLEQVSADGGVAYLSEGFLNFEHRRPRRPAAGPRRPRLAQLVQSRPAARDPRRSNEPELRALPNRLQDPRRRPPPPHPRRSRRQQPDRPHHRRRRHPHPHPRRRTSHPPPAPHHQPQRRPHRPNHQPRLRQHPQLPRLPPPPGPSGYESGPLVATTRVETTLPPSVDLR